MTEDLLKGLGSLLQEMESSCIERLVCTLETATDVPLVS